MSERTEPTTDELAEDQLMREALEESVAEEIRKPVRKARTTRFRPGRIPRAHPIAECYRAQPQRQSQT